MCLTQPITTATENIVGSLELLCYRSDVKTSLAFLGHALHLSGATLLETSAHAAFLSLPHCCPLLDTVDLSLQPRVPSLGGFLELVQKRVTSEEFHWWGSREEGGRAGSAESSTALACNSRVHMRNT